MHKLNKRLCISCGIIYVFFCSLNGSFSVVEAVSPLKQTGEVNVEITESSPLVDPENPIQEVSPEKSYSTKGELRIDYVSTFSFGSNKITKSNRKYAALAQQFHGDIGARGNYIQITNLQQSSSGWSLQVKQSKQFTSKKLEKEENRQLKGAVLSLDKGWANSISQSRPPTVTRETIAINELGVAYEVAHANENEAKGTWLISFGASETNKNQQAPTLSPLFDSANNKLVDNVYGKQLYKNSAVTLSVPDSSNIYPVSYETELIWILGKMP